MLGRPLILTGLLGAAVGVPMAVSNAPQDWNQGFSNFGNAFGGGSNAQQQNAAPLYDPYNPQPIQQQRYGPNSLIYDSPVPLEGLPSPSLAEALRMDVTSQWVYSRWARKSTGLADPELFGVRVPLVTGHAMTDLAGSLTYYFDEVGIVQKLKFHGRTADTTQLVALAQNYFGLQPQRGQPGEQLFETRVKEGVQSRLRTRPEPVLWATKPHDSFLVDMEINRPGSGRLVQEPPLQLNLPPALAPPVVQATTQPVTQPPYQAAANQPASNELLDTGKGTNVEAGSGELQQGRLPDFRWPN